MHYNCLIVDDEEALSSSTSEYFNMFGVNTCWVTDADSCLEFLKENTVDVILLDINLGDDSGFEICRKIRESRNTPILFISARTSDDDVLLALGIGGDDYIQKPYSLSVLLAKIRVVLKRYYNDNDKPEKDVFGGFIIDYSVEKLLLNGQEIKLKTMEYKLLSYLVRNKNKIVSKNELFSKVWEDSFAGDSTLNVHIRRLREKIEENPNEPLFIKTVWGTGYIFECL